MKNTDSVVKQNHRIIERLLLCVWRQLYRGPLTTALGAYLRRLKARKGPMKAITVTAHKLAKIIYNMLRHGAEYMEADHNIMKSNIEIDQSEI